jgi:hypothetical protein
MINDQAIRESLTALKPISLEKINSDCLMDRMEIKYVFSIKKLCQLINLMKDQYVVLEIQNTRALPYFTTYFDTHGYMFYNQHTRGELARYKIRYRKYEINGDSFLEIKMRSNKNRIIKWRIENNFQSGGFDDQADNFINEYLPVRSTLLTPVLINRFNRITMVGKGSEERITLDYNINFTDPVTGFYTEMPYLAVVEMKKPGISQFSPFNSLVKQMNIYPEGFSKYCTGSAILKKDLKANMVKPKILLLNKIENEYIKSYSN